MYPRLGWRPLPISIPAESHLWIVAVLGFGVGDVLTTGVGLSLGGIEEGGPLVAALLDRYGIASLVGLKLAWFGLSYAVWIVVPVPDRIGIPLGLAALGVAVTAWNTVVLAVALW